MTPGQISQKGFTRSVPNDRREKKRVSLLSICVSVWSQKRLTSVPVDALEDAILAALRAEAMYGNGDEFRGAFVDVVIGVHLAKFDHTRIGE